MFGKIKEWLHQFSDYVFSDFLTVEDYQPVTVILSAALLVGTTSGSDTYQVPNPYTLLVKRVRGHIGFNNYTGETLSITGIGNPGFLDRLAMKAANCAVEFKNTSKKYDIFDNNDNTKMRVSDLISQIGGEAVEFNPPLVVLTAQVLEADMTLNDTNATVVGASTDYGIIVEGVLVRSGNG